MKKVDPVRIFLAAEIERRELDMAALSRQVGRNHAYIQQFLKRGIPRHLPEEVRSRLAEALDVDETTLGGRINTKPRAEQASTELREIGEWNAFVSAGGGTGGNSFDDEERIATWPIPRPYLDELSVSGGMLALVPVKGDSMEPTLRSGDRVMIDMGDRNVAQPGIFLIADETGRVVKRVETIPASRPARLKLISDNPLHTRYDVLAEQVEIIGRVIWAARRL